jgi:hypothetical protein
LKTRGKFVGYKPEIQCAQGGWKEAAKAACFQVLVANGVDVQVLKVVETC